MAQRDFLKLGMKYRFHWKDKRNMQIPSDQMQDVLYKLFIKYKFPEVKARSLAKVYTDSTLDGVSSHGINRVPLFIKYVEDGIVKVDAEAEKVEAFGSMERFRSLNDFRYASYLINSRKFYL